MPKHAAGTPKAIAKQLKAKGLQKLRWYCQMCQKQCRDENGFKCHLTSESHQRQMQIVGANPKKFVDEFSVQFEKGFLDLLSRRYGERRIPANYVYNEFIKDRHHTHMNSTMWTTLTEFVQYLGRTSKCLVEEDPDKGWLIQWIDRSADALARKQKLKEMKEKDLSEEQRHRKHLLKLAKEARRKAEAEGRLTEAGPAELQRDMLAAPIRLTLGGATGAAKDGAAAEDSEGSAEVETKEGAAPGTDATDTRRPAGVAAVFAAGTGATAASADAPGRAARQPQKRARNAFSTLEELRREEEALKRRREERAAAAAAAWASAAQAAPASASDSASASGAGRLDHWLAEGIVVKVVNKSVEGGKLYKRKGVVRRVHDKYVAEVRLLEPKLKLRIDQEDLETVIPKPGGEVLFLNGPHRGQEGRVVELRVDKYCADVELRTGSSRGQLVRGVEYEDISKLYHRE